MKRDRLIRILSCGAVFGLMAACGRGATLEGTLADPTAATHVWVEGMAEPAEVVEGFFRLEGLRADTLDLRFADGDRDRGWMRLLGLPRGAHLNLHGVWFDSDLAFPTAIELDGARTVSIHGLRMGSPDRVSGSVDERGSVLARSGERALLVRPENDRLPDLRVVISPGTRVRGEDGDPVSLERLDFGDRVRVTGTAEDGYVLAAEITISREASAGFEGAGPPAERDAEPGPLIRGPVVSPTPLPPPSPAPSPADAGPDGRGPDGRGPPGRGPDPPGRGRGPR